MSSRFGFQSSLDATGSAAWEHSQQFLAVSMLLNINKLIDFLYVMIELLIYNFRLNFTEMAYSGVPG